jgi:tetratricopeptide (TPR) repeat protein
MSASKWIVCCVLLLAGCETSSSSRSSPSRLSRDDDDFSKALAHYAEGLVRETERDHAKISTNAQTAFAEAHRFDPDSRPPVDALVMNLLSQQRTPEALDVLEKFCHDHPDDFSAQRDLARVSETEGDNKRAARHYAEAFRLEPDAPIFAYAQIRTLFEDKQDAEALRVMRDLQRKHPGTDSSHLPLFWAIQLSRHVEQPERAIPCIKLAEKLATNDTQRTEYHIFQGQLDMLAGRTNDAEEVFRDVLESNPLHIPAIMALSAILRQRDGANAVTLQTRRAGKDPTATQWLLLAAIHLAANDRTNAAPALVRAHDALLAQNTPPPETFDLLQGSTLDELGRRDAAAAVFQEALKRHPHADEIMNYLAYMWAEEKIHLDEAEKLSKQSLLRRPRNGAYLDTLGWVLFQQGRSEEALNFLLRARSQLPNDATVLGHVGDVLATLNRTPEAAAYWSRSYAIDPAQKDVEKKLRDCGVDPARIPRLDPKHLKKTSTTLDDDPDDDGP